MAALGDWAVGLLSTGFARTHVRQNRKYVPKRTVRHMLGLDPLQRPVRTPRMRGDKVCPRPRGVSLDNGQHAARSLTGQWPHNMIIH